MAQEEFLRRLLRAYPWFILTLAIVIIGTYSAYQLIVPTYFPSPGVQFYIPPKSSLRQITTKLEADKIIRSAGYLRAYLTLTGQARQIKPGFYTFEGSITLAELVRTLLVGGQGIKITFPEGLTLVEIQDLLKQKNLTVNLKNYQLGNFPQSELLKYFPASTSLEGFLAPDTYEFFPEQLEPEIITTFLTNFEKKILPELLKYPMSTAYRTITLASLLEKEVRHSEDLQLVAGIIDKRAQAGRRLEVDASVAYPKCLAMPCNWHPSRTDLLRDTPYNTYRRTGYPPTPISNPGLNTIRAALTPRTSDFWFYLTDEAGKTIFAKTYREHQKNIRLHLR